MAIGLGLRASTAGTILSLIFIPRWLRRHLLAIAAAAPALMTPGLAVLSLWQGWAGFVLGAAAIEFGSGAVAQGLMLVSQSVVPTDIMGSVAGALSMFHMVLVPAGMAMAGVVAFTYGPAAAVICAAALVASEIPAGAALCPPRRIISGMWQPAAIAPDCSRPDW